MDGKPVKEWMKPFSLGTGTYTDDGVRANEVILGDSWEAATLAFNNIPTNDNFTVTLNVNGTEHTVSLPYVYVGNASLLNDFSNIIALNEVPKTGSRREDDILFAEAQIVSALGAKIASLSSPDALKRSPGVTPSMLNRAQVALNEMKVHLDLIASNSKQANELIAKQGRRALVGPSRELPYIPSVRERMSKVARLVAIYTGLEVGYDAVAVRAADDAQFEQKLRIMHAEAEKKSYETLAATKDSSSVVSESQKNENNKKAAATTTAPVLSGSGSQFKTYIGNSRSAASYASYKTTTVLQLRRFRYSTSDTTWVDAVKAAHTSRASKGLTENLIIDVSDNGGGLVCLNFDTLAYMVEPWRTKQKAGPDVLYSAYDMRISAVSDLLYDQDQLDDQGEYDMQTGALLTE